MMRSQEESVHKRDDDTTRYFNESGERTAEQPFEQKYDHDRQEFEEQHFVKEQESEEDEDTGSQRMVAEDEEMESPGRKSVEYDKEVEHELMESSSSSWESVDEDDRLDDRLREHSVAVVRETPPDIAVSRLNVVPDSDRRHRQISTKTSLRGQQLLCSLLLLITCTNECLRRYLLV